MKLPAQIRGKQVRELTRRDLRIVHSTVHLFHLIETTYKSLWRTLGPALKTKQRMGFCAVNLSCTNMTNGKRRACDDCAKAIKSAAERRLANGGGRAVLTPYKKWKRNKK